MKEMTFSRKGIFIAWAILLSSIDLAFAQDDLTTFREPVNNAIRYNKSLKNAELENQKVALDQQMVKGKLLPTVSANAMYGYVNSLINIDLPTQNLPITGINLFEGSQSARLSTQVGLAGVTATQVIFSGLQISNGQKALEQKFKAQRLLQEASYDQVAQEVIMCFDQLMLLKEVDLLIADSEKRLNKEHQKVMQAIENGLAIPYDRDKIKLAILELESKKAEVESNRELLHYKLSELTGMKGSALENVRFKLKEILLDKDTATVMNRKEISALEASQKAYEYAYKKEKGTKLPQVFAFGNVSYVNAFGTSLKIKDLPVVGDLKLSSNQLMMAPNYAIGIGAKWTIFEGKTHQTAIDKAKIDMQINENKLSDTKEKLALLQRKTIVDYDLSMKKIKVNEQQVEIAKNNLYLASRQFEEGLSDVTDRLEAENEYYKQTLNYYTQILNQRTAALELLKANGNLYQTVTR
ncbi:TolC family protein [Sphingobacterium sp. DK4209]|uniref:TolC family protein n=1 Tax=Sphingobacterium zhuxiongii TaxID=2662364 RepID=A0A5Q0QEF4_9SPHI|nr:MULTISPECIES: TolC family protein [unclassified Sphingobacterium]MVZ65191.1 TolC family protein [Sphingobacterium sp. DK4209]QGA26138.1 TolC family protein [Sphingobacterium sp. dk4302]